MKCQYCKQAVFGANGITIVGVGSSHKSCLEAELALSRVFKGLDLSSLNHIELADLKEIVLSEETSRSKTRVEAEIF